MHSIRLAVAIPTYNRDEVLIATLNGLFAQHPPADEVLVIDQSAAHAPEVATLLARWDREGRIRHIHHSPANLPGARNRALAESSCEVVLFIDDDVELQPGFVQAHRRRFELDDSIAAVAGRVTQPPGLVQPRGNRDYWRRELDYRYLNMDSPHPQTGIACFMGGNHSIRVPVALGLGGYDEGFAGVGMREESVMALRLHASGGIIVYEPGAHLIHLRAPEGGCRPRDPYDTSGGESILRFARKHRQQLGIWGFTNEVWLGLRSFLLNRTTLQRPIHLLVRLGRLLAWVGRSSRQT